MYELLAGRHPCTGAETREIQHQILNPSYKFEPPSKFNQEIDPKLDKIILKALRRKIDHRYQSLTEMLMDLSRITGSRI